jgi:hypothetical protein
MDEIFHFQISILGLFFYSEKHERREESKLDVGYCFEKQLEVRSRNSDMEYSRYRAEMSCYRKENRVKFQNKTF